MAQGGIIGLKQGGPPNPGRRNFMKIMAGLASIPVFGKFFKGAKVAKTSCTSYKHNDNNACMVSGP